MQARSSSSSPGWLQSKGTNESCTKFHVRQTEVYSKRNIILRCFRFPSHSLQKRPNGWHSWNLYLVRSKWASNAVPRLCCSQQHISCRPILRDYSSFLFWQAPQGYSDGMEEISIFSLFHPTVGAWLPRSFRVLFLSWLTDGAKGIPENIRELVEI